MLIELQTPPPPDLHIITVYSRQGWRAVQVGSLRKTGVRPWARRWARQWRILQLWWVNTLLQLPWRRWLVNTILCHNWAATCDFQQCGILTCVDSYEPVQPTFMLRNSKWCSTSKGSDQTVRMRRLVWAFAGRTYHIVGNFMPRLIFH